MDATALADCCRSIKFLTNAATPGRSARHPPIQGTHLEHLPTNYFGLLNNASWQEIAYFWALNGSLLPQNPLENVGDVAPHFFLWVLL